MPASEYYIDDTGSNEVNDAHHEYKEENVELIMIYEDDSVIKQRPDIYAYQQSAVLTEVRISDSCKYKYGLH